MATGNDNDDLAERPTPTGGWISSSPPSGGNPDAPRSVPPLYVDGSPDDESSSLRSRLTLAIAVVGSLLLIGAAVLFWRHDDAGGSAPALALPEPWVPPTVPATGSSGPVPPVSGAVTIPTVVPPSPGADDGGDGAPPGTTRPTTGAPPATTRPTTPPAQGGGGGVNLSLAGGADSDGSSKASGTSFGDVQDGDLSTFWSPKDATTGQISIKWPAAVTLGSINIREASGGGVIRTWRVLNYDTGGVLTSGTGAGLITFTPATLKKITFEILSATGVPRVAEFETFAP